MFTSFVGGLPYEWLWRKAPQPESKKTRWSVDPGIDIVGLLDETSHSLMKSAMSQLQLSARAYHRVLKLARTIADLAGAENIAPAHLAEAIQYRPRGMGT